MQKRGHRKPQKNNGGPLSILPSLSVKPGPFYTFKRPIYFPFPNALFNSLICSNAPPLLVLRFNVIVILIQLAARTNNTDGCSVKCCWCAQIHSSNLCRLIAQHQQRRSREMMEMLSALLFFAVKPGPFKYS